MKQLIALAIIAVTGIANAQSSYDILSPVRKVLTAEITGVRNISGPALLPEVGVKGQLVIDKRMKQVGLSVLQYNKIVYQTTLKLLSYTKDEHCGIVVYTAGTDPRSLNLVVEFLTIVDNSNNKCQVEDRLYHPTEVRLDRTVYGEVMDRRSSEIDLTELRREIAE